MTTIIAYLPPFIILLVATIYSGTAYFKENTGAYPNYRFLAAAITDDSVKKTSEAEIKTRFESISALYIFLI